jgi:hypothetical protein
MTPFHAFFTKKRKTKQCCFLGGTVSPSSPGRATGEEKFLFFFPLFLHLFPFQCAKLKPKPDATRTSL